VATLNPVAGCISGAAARTDDAGRTVAGGVDGKWTRSTSASGDGVMA
jgi:hypothetical protein